MADTACHWLHSDFAGTPVVSRVSDLIGLSKCTTWPYAVFDVSTNRQLVKSRGAHRRRAHDIGHLVGRCGVQASRITDNSAEKKGDLLTVFLPVTCSQLGA